MKKKITYGKNVYNKKEIYAVHKVLKKTTQMGKSVTNFENKIARHFSKKYGLMVNSGSSALILALKVMNFPKSSEVITPCLNFGTAVSSIILCNLKPIFVDCNRETLQIDENKIEKKITSKTKCLLIPNLIGNIPNWIKIKKIAKKYKLKIIEDSADTIGAKIYNKSTGLFSDISITSFYGSHLISCAGNGGCFLTNNQKYYNQAKILRSWGRMSSSLKNSENINYRLNVKLKGISYDKKFIFSEIGYNFEPSEISAAFGLEQLKKLAAFSKKRNTNFNLHKFFFNNYNNYFIVPKILKNVRTYFLAYPIILKDKKINKKKFQIYLENKNIQTRPIFSGNILRHPAFNNLVSKRNKISQFKESDYIMKNGLLVGCHQGLSYKDIIYIHKVIKKYLTSV